MLFREQFEEISRRVEEGRSADLTVEIDGKCYCRTFRAEKRAFLVGEGGLSLALCSAIAAKGFSVVVINDRPELANPAVYPEAKTILCGPYGAAMKAVRVRQGDCVVLTGDSYLHDPEISAVLREAAPMSVVVAGAPERSEAVGQTQVRFVSPRSDAVITALEDGRAERRPADEARPVLAQEEIDPELLRFLAASNLGKALLMVYGVEGDAPVRPGAIMVVDEYRRTFGTFGGSASQRKLVRTASGLIGTGRQVTVDIPLDNDFNRVEGNFHQGTLRVVLADVTDPSRMRT